MVWGVGCAAEAAPSTPHSRLTTLCPTLCSHAHTLLPDYVSYRDAPRYRRQYTLSKLYISFTYSVRAVHGATELWVFTVVAFCAAWNGGGVL